MTSTLIAPTEPEPIKSLGRSSSIPEEYGADIMWGTEHGLVLIQRKRIDDFIASMNDGRLSKEITQMDNSAAYIRMVLIEGEAAWTDDGQHMGRARVTLRQLRSFLWSIRLRGVWVDTTGGLSDTVRTVEWLKAWSVKDRHQALLQRGSPPTSSWGRVTDRDWAIHLLCGFDGIGVGTAESIIDYFGGVPLGWEVGIEELKEVPGIGKVRAKNLVKALEVEDE